MHIQSSPGGTSSTPPPSATPCTAPKSQEDATDRSHARLDGQDSTVAAGNAENNNRNTSPDTSDLFLQYYKSHTGTEAGVPLVAGMNEDEDDALVLIVLLLNIFKGRSTISSLSLSSTTGLRRYQYRVRCPRRA